MSKELGVVELNSGITVADSRESKGGLGGGMVENLESKTLGKDSIGKVGLGDCVRVLDGASINGSGRDVFESGSIEVNTFYGGSKDRVKSKNNGWEPWGVMNLVGRMLGGKYCIDNETRDTKISEKQPEVNLASDMNAWQSVIGEPMSENGIDIKENEIEGDHDKLNLEFQGEGNALNGKKHSISIEMVPDGKMETEGDDSKDYASTSKELGESITGKEGQYHVSDLVWGKVLSHPWWPGQIFELSAASDKVKKYFKGDSYLIAYFGEQTFAWNDVSKIKPFQMHFSQLEKEGNVDGFCDAVACALTEVSRRVELSLSCPCLPQGVLHMVKCQDVLNAGIRGGDNLSSGTSFLPGELMLYLESLAQSPKSKPDRLQLTIAKAQLLSFYRWKGRYHFPIYQECGRFLEVAAQSIATGEVRESPQGIDLDSTNNFPSKKRKASARGSYSQKCKRLSGYEKRPKTKVNDLSVLTSSTRSSIHKKKPTIWEIVPSDIQEESRATASVDNLWSGTSFLPGELMLYLELLAQSPKSKQDRLQLTMVKTQLLALSRWKGHYSLPIYQECGRFLDDASLSIVMAEVNESLQGPYLDNTNNFPSKKRKPTAQSYSQKSKRLSGDEKAKEFSVLMFSSSSSMHNDKPSRWEIIPSEIPPPDVILSELIVAAKNPKQGCEARISLVGLLREFWNTICLAKSSPGCTSKDAIEHGGETPPNLEIADIFEMDGAEDSNGTGRIIQSYSEDQAIIAPKNASESAAHIETNTGAVLNPANNSKEREIIHVDLDAEDSSVLMNEPVVEHFPTAILLTFTSLESIPSVANLNVIFRRYGPLKESETEVLTKSKRAKVIFKRREDAETAFSSTGKYRIFGPSLRSYRLNYAPASRRPRAMSKRGKKNTSLKVDV